MTAPEKTLPHNIDAEESVLGALLLDRDAILKVAAFLRPEDFHREKNGRVYQAILYLYDRREPTDLLTLSALSTAPACPGQHDHPLTSWPGTQVEASLRLTER